MDKNPADKATSDVARLCMDAKHPHEVKLGSMGQHVHAQGGSGVTATEGTEGNTGNLKPWEPGQSGNPKGRPKGSRNALGEDFLKALHEDFQASGVAAIQSMRADKPAEYVKVIASILPKELNVKIDPIEELTDDELINRLHALRAAYNAVTGRVGAIGDGVKPTLEHAEITALPPLH